MQQIFAFINEHTWIYRVGISIAVLPAVYICRTIAMRWIKKAPIKSPDLRRRWMGLMQQLSIALGIILIFFIWASQLQTLAFSLIAVAAAIVIATKELLLCILGSILKAATGIFTLGDRIEINGVRGQVIDQGVLTTRLMEVGPGKLVQQYTGRTLAIPNAWFLSHTLINETNTSAFDLHTFTIPIHADDNWQEHELWLLEAANEICKPHLAEAQKSLERYAERRFIDKFAITPRVTPSIPEPDRIDLVVRIPVPNGFEDRLQRMITRKYLENYLKNKQKNTQTTHN